MPPLDLKGIEPMEVSLAYIVGVSLGSRLVGVRVGVEVFFCFCFALAFFFSRQRLLVEKVFKDGSSLENVNKDRGRVKAK